MSRVNAVRKVITRKRQWRGISTPVIVGTVIAVVTVALLAFLVTRGKRVTENQVHTEPIAGAPSSAAHRVTVRLNEAANVGNDLSITLTEVQQQPDTKKYKVWAKVLIKDQPDMQVRRAEEGYAVTYPEEHGYTIELIKATADSAKFSITKNP